MKQKKINRVRSHPAFPGAASQSYFIGKMLNTVTAVASGMGCLTVLLFFLLL